MKSILIIGIGGFIGAISRYQLAAAVAQLAGHGRFAWGTFAVNVLGCLVLGLLAGVAERHAVLGADARLFLFTGLLGGFTTFSAFGLETVQMLRRGDVAIAALYAGGSVVLGVMAVWLGLKLVAMASH